MKIKTFLWLLALAILFGVSFPFVKTAVREIPPLTLVAARVTLGAALLYLILRLEGRNLPGPGPIWRKFTISGLLYNALPYALMSWGLQHVDSALSAILIGTTPLFTMVLAHLFTPDDHFTAAKTTGMVVGFGGLVVMLGPELLNGFHATTWGLLASVAAAASYAGAIVYIQRNLRGLQPLVAPTAQLTTAALFLIPLALLNDRPYTLPLPSWPALTSLLMVSVFSTAVVFVLYYRAMEIMSATTLSLSAYMVPVVAAILGVVFLHERLGWNAYLGFILIISGVMIVNDLLQSIGWRTSTGAAVKASNLSQNV